VKCCLAQKPSPETVLPTLRQLVSEHYRGLYEFALVSMQDEVAAQDLVVSVLLEGGEDTGAADSFRSRRQRLLKRVMARGDEPAVAETDRAGVAATVSLVTGDFAELDVSVALNRQWLSDCVAQLSLRERQLLYLTHGAHMSPLEMADLMACSVEQVTEQMTGVQQRVLDYLNLRLRTQPGAADVH